ncbi:hypothetical protein BCR44DRAFT_65826 [Catenaria anguillulae PL171]|uniref:Uncharacterized protein n=1 Tax=Catenaria anguillulae PL171 TaxID=765915 RepID=A0A1Y2HG76_9FUNG|nr:hypothetical protein BCR44DRAFT_65826 [Catenaria anguillulae PL171]
MASRALACSSSSSSFPTSDVAVFAADFSASTRCKKDYSAGVGSHFDSYVTQFGAGKVIALRWDSRVHLFWPT